MAKWACVTGASSGIGAATAALLGRSGWDLVLLARRREKLESLAAEIMADPAAAGRQIQMHKIDLNDASALDELCKKLPAIEVLVNNAGLAKGFEHFQESQLQDIDLMVDTNIRAVMRMTRLLLPGMMARKRGHIINLGSVAGRWVYPRGAVYCASKFAIRAFSEGLRMDVAGTGIRVTNIEPGMVETEFSEVRLRSADAAKKVYEKMQPLSATDIAETILWSVQRPAHVDIQELVIFPTDQAAVGQVHRQK